MKKIILILSLCLSLLGLSSITYAAEWNWIASNDSTTISFIQNQKGLKYQTI